MYLYLYVETLSFKLTNAWIKKGHLALVSGLLGRHTLLVRSGWGGVARRS